MGAADCKSLASSEGLGTGASVGVLGSMKGMAAVSKLLSIGKYVRSLWSGPVGAGPAGPIGATKGLPLRIWSITSVKLTVSGR